MADVKWIKIVTDVFDDEKLLLIETLPEADSIIVIWFKLLCLAGKQNNSGVFLMNDRIPYTEKMLATIFRRKESTVQLALRTFQDFGMIEIVDGVITIPNWGKHQNFDKIEKNNEYMRNYMRDYRAKQKLLTQNTKLCEIGLPMEQWNEVLEEFNHECAYCGETEGLEQEHIIPVNRGGKYELGNIIPACRSCNASKGNKEMQNWYENSEVFDARRLEKIKEYCVKFNVNINVSSLRKVNVSGLDKNREDKNRIDNIKDIVEYLNLKINSKYRPSTKSTKDSIIARLNEGFTVEDFKTVIDNQYAKWHNTEWEQYLRPQTLFGTKFESYLNTPVKGKKDSNANIDWNEWDKKNNNSSQLDSTEIDKLLQEGEIF